MPPHDDSESPSRFSSIKNWYRKFERPISSLSLIGGFVFDALTLTRVDELWENIWVIVHLLIVGICIILIHAIEHEEGSEHDPAKLHFWLVNALQFFFGGIFSTFLVFYFRSGSLIASWPFFVILAAAFVANESLKKHYSRLVFQIILFYLSIFLFAIYIVPVLVHGIGTWQFILSGVASLVVMWLFLLIFRLSARETVAKGRWSIAAIIVILFAGVNTLYFFKLIPPLPISLKDAGIYESFTVNAPGNYTAQYEDQGWFSFFKWQDDITIAPGAPLYVYSAVFAPAKFSTSIIHEWQTYDETTRAWVTRGEITLPIVGGSDGGWRTFSMLPNVTPGSWRVNVKTTTNQVIGTLRFDVTVASTSQALETEQID